VADLDEVITQECRELLGKYLFDFNRYAWG